MPNDILFYFFSVSVWYVSNNIYSGATDVANIFSSDGYESEKTERRRP